MSTLAPDVIAQVQSVVDEYLAQRGGQPFTRDQADQLDTLATQVGSLLDSQGGVPGGPQSIDGVAIVDGTVTVNKITVNTLDALTVSTGSLNVTGDVVAAASFPATGARIVINSSGLWGYSGAATTTFKLNTDGSGEIGTGSNKVTWNTSGVVSIPTAVITSLTIANVGSGNLGGAYATGSSNPKITFSSSGIVATNSGGSTTFQLNATTGAVTATGSYTVQSAASGARVSLSSAGGLEGYNSSGTRTFFVNAADGSAQIGTVSGGFAISSSGNVSISGSLLVGGTINATSVTVTNLTASNVTSGNLGSGSSGINIGGTNGLGINGTLTIASGGSIVDADGSTWSQSGITLVSAGSFGDTIKWRNGGVDRASIYSSSSSAIFAWDATHGGFVDVGTSSATLGVAGSSLPQIIVGTSQINVQGQIHPGTDAGGTQTGRYIDVDGTNAFLYMHTTSLRISGSGSFAGLRFDAIANGGSASNWSSFTSANIPDKAAGYIKINIAGTNYRVAFWADA